MKLIVKIFVLFTLSLLAVDSYAQKSKKTLMFYEIDDKARIFVDGEMIFESDLLGHLGSVELKVDLTKYLRTGEEEITIELINVVCMECTNNEWRITYEALEDGEGMDYQSEKGASQGGDEAMYSYTFYWNDL